jgi:hypothetical protein
MSVRLAVRTTGKKVKVFLTSAGSVERGKALAQHPKARAAQSCIAQAHGNKTEARKCLARI